MLIFDPYPRYIRRPGPPMPLPGLIRFFERSTGTAIERIGQLVTIDFTNFLLWHYGDNRMAHEAMALTIAEKLFNDVHFIGRPERAPIIARSELRYAYSYTRYNMDFRERFLYFSNYILKLNPFRQQQQVAYEQIIANPSQERRAV